MKAKMFLAIVFLCGSFGLAQAQTGISVGGSFNLPLSTFDETAGIGLGLNIGFSYPYHETFDIIGGIGFNPYLEKEKVTEETIDDFFLGEINMKTIQKIKWSGIPVRVGIRFKPKNMGNSDKIVFLEAKGGIIYQKLKHDIAFDINEQRVTPDDFPDDDDVQRGMNAYKRQVGSSGNHGSFALGAGVMINKIGFSVEYNMGFWQWLGLKAFYQFGGEY